jgi:hypothetical protein
VEHVRALPSSPASWRLRRLVGAGAVALVVALTGGCGFLDASAQPAPSSPQSSARTASSDATASATPAAATSDSAAAADLAGSADDRPASLAVSVTAPEQGVPPVDTVDGPLAAECSLDAAATEYVTLGIRFTDPSPVTKQRGNSSNLRLDITTVGGSDVGVVVDTVNATTYCDGTAVLPPQSELQSQNLTDEHQTMTVYVVARTTPADPDPLRAVTVQLRNLRHHPDGIDARDWTWDVQQVTAGRACPDAPTSSLCVPLG